MHEFTPEVESLAKEILDYSLIRLKDNPPLDGPKSVEELYALVGNTITKGGLGGSAALSIFKDCLLYTSPSPRDGLLSRMPSSA